MVKKRTQYHYALRRLKRKTDLIKAGKLLVASMEGDLHLLKEMKSARGGKGGQSELPETVARLNGQEEVVNKFREVYSTLYNSAESEAEMAELLATMIQDDSVGEVGKVTEVTKVKEPLGLLKPKKTDVSAGFTSDGKLHAPDILFDQLASIFQDGWSMVL